MNAAWKVITPMSLHKEIIQSRSIQESIRILMWGWWEGQVCDRSTQDVRASGTFDGTSKRPPVRRRKGDSEITARTNEGGLGRA